MTYINSFILLFINFLPAVDDITSPFLSAITIFSNGLIALHYFQNIHHKILTIAILYKKEGYFS